ncbi:hypothetical protein MMC30_000893 [Trapelia coarctata]|nr:hypothetical protein [Trapelia coarctata]
MNSGEPLAAEALQDSIPGSAEKSEDTSINEKTDEKIDESPVVSSEEHHYPTGLKLSTIVTSLMLAVFCVALDNTIIATAIPKITNEFAALNDVGWYASAYLLTTCSFQLLFGKFYTYFNIKYVFLAALFVFELGSLICGVAPNSTALIVGRAIAGLGSSGIFTGALVTLAHIVPLVKRPIYFGLIGGMYGIASVAGPLIGGAFTDKVTWRWCFYINLPLGAVTAAGLVVFLKLEGQEKRERVSLGRQILRFDPLGTMLFVPAIVCLLLALQWGGTQYPWSNGRIIALFVLFGVLLITFVCVQIWLGDDATVPPRIARKRSIAFGAFFSLCIGSTFFLLIYYLPIWFQAIYGVDAIHSGIDNLPLILSQVLGTIIAGAGTTKTGYYMPFVWASVVFMAIGGGLLTTFTVDISTAKWVIYQLIFGLGTGFGFQLSGIAAQATLELKDIPIGTAMVMFVQLLGGAIFVSIGQNLWTNSLVTNIAALGIPNFDPINIVHAGATQLRSLVPPMFLPQVLVAYNAAIIKTFQAALAMACLSALGAAGMEWKSVKGKTLEAGGA